MKTIIWFSILAAANMVCVFTNPWLFLRIINGMLSLVCAFIAGYMLPKEGE